MLLKFFRYLVFIFAFIGAFVLAYAGFQFFMTGKFDNLMGKTGLDKAEQEETSGMKDTPADPQVASLVEGFKEKKPAAAAATAENPSGFAAATSTSSTATTQIAKPVKTPGPDTGIITNWPTGHKLVALTFDDGPHPEWTPKFIELLKSKNVKATFFLLGPQVEKHPEIVKALVEAGFEVGNHSMTHPELNKKTAEQIQQELGQVNALVKQAAGIDMGLMRPPYGKAPKKVQDIAHQLGFQVINWNVDTNDWGKKSTEESMKQEVMKNLKDGAIILMHDRYEKSYSATAAVIDPIRQQGYEFVTVSELLGLKPNVPHGEGATSATATAFAASAPTASSHQQKLGATKLQTVMATPAPPSTLATGAGAPLPSPAKAPEPTPVPSLKTADGTQLPAVSTSKITGAPARK